MEQHSVTDYYEGSRIFAGLAHSLGLSVDKFNFVISQLAALLLASLFRTVLHPSKTSASLRHFFGLSIGLLIGFFCFGKQAIHIAALPTACYLVIITQNPKVVQRIVLAVAMLYLSLIHIHRQIYDYGSANLDITGPLMVITQKVTSLAFNIHDGLAKNEDQLTKTQKLNAVKRVPSTLEYFSFLLHFPSLMAGPSMLFKDYMDFVDGSNLRITGKENEKEPSPITHVVKKVLIAILCALAFTVFLPMFPLERVKEQDFLDNSSLFQKFLFLFVCTTLTRFKYYFAWTLADGICNNAGLGYNGVDETGYAKWDKFTNVDILKFELATNLRDSIDAWNLGTNQWLRMTMYERMGKNSMVYTYGLSAIWHGFYPGYYLTFFNGFLFTYASRKVRKTVRPYFRSNSETRLLYDCITFLVTRILMIYLSFTFVLLEFWPCIRVYTHLYWCIHLGSLAAIFLVPQLIPKTMASSSKSGIAHALDHARPITNGVSRHYD